MKMHGEAWFPSVEVGGSLREVTNSLRGVNAAYQFYLIMITGLIDGLTKSRVI